MPDQNTTRPRVANRDGGGNVNSDNDHLIHEEGNHSREHRRPESAVGKHHDGRMEGYEGVLVSLSIATGSGRGTSVNSSHNGGRENHVWSVSVEKGARKSRNVSDNALKFK